MFTHQTILSLRLGSPGTPGEGPVFGHLRDLHFVRNVMEAKQFLLRSLSNRNHAYSYTPDVILVDAGSSNPAIKTELERWMEAHPQFDRIKVTFPAKLSWIGRLWKRWTRGEGHTATTG